MAPKPILGYWDIRGLGEPLRLMLTYLNVEFEDKLYTAKPPEFECPAWLADKFSLGLDFPNLPYYIEGDLKLTQSVAIARYIARKHNLDGQSEEEKIAISMVEQQLYDCMSAFSRVAYNPNCDKLKEEYLQTLSTHLKLLSDYLKDKPFVAGVNISYVDFWLYEYLLKIATLCPEQFAPFDNLKKFIGRFESLPRVSTYIKSQPPRFFNGPMAKWNGSR